MKTVEEFLRGVQAARNLSVVKNHIFPNLAGVRFTTYPNRDRVKLALFIPQNGTCWQKQAGPYASLLKAGEYEIKGAALDNIELMKRVMLFEPVKDDDTRQVFYHRVQPRKRDHGKDRDPQYIEVERLCMFLAFMMSTRLQNQLIDRFKTLRHPRHYYYVAAWEMNLGRLKEIKASVHSYFENKDGEIEELIYQNAMNPDHLGSFLPAKVDLNGLTDTPVFKHERDTIFEHVIHTIGGVKKALSRYKLSYHNMGADIGTHKCFVLTKIPEVIKPYHEAGGIYAPHALVERIGPSRVSGPYLQKGAIGPQNRTLESEFPDTIVLSKNSFKGDYQGLAEASGISVPEVIARTQTRTFMGAEVQGIEVMLPMTITNLMVGYGVGLNSDVKADPTILNDYKDDPILAEFVRMLGMRYKIFEEIEYPESDEDESEAEQVEPTTSVYLYLIDKLNLDHSFDPAYFVEHGIKVGLFQESKTRVDVKGFDVMNVSASHGLNVAASFVKSVMNALPNRKPNELNEFLKVVGKTRALSVSSISWDIVQKVALDVWSNTDVMTSKLDPEHLVRMAKVRGIKANEIGEYTKSFIADYLSLLENERPKVVIVGEYKFYIPSGNVLKAFIYPEVDTIGRKTGRYFFGGAAYLVNELFAMLAKFKRVMPDKKTFCIPIEGIPETYLKMFSLWYYARMQKDMFGKYGENVSVSGWANKMALPNPVSVDTCVCFDEEYEAWHGKVTVMSKVPVLFNKAVHGVRYDTDGSMLNIRMTERMLFALKRCVFVPTSILLAHQNDTDGDLIRMMFIENHGVPVFTGAELPDYMKSWQHEYESGERDLDFKLKEYESTDDVRELDEALREAWTAKHCIGRATNLFNTISFLLMSEYGVRATKLRDAMMMLLQRVIRNVKHEGDEEDILTYLSEISFVDIYGALAPVWDESRGKNVWVDNTAEKIHELATWIRKEVPDADVGLLYELGQIYTMEHVRACYYKGKHSVQVGPFEYVLKTTMPKLTEEYQYLGMYVRTLAGRITNTLITGKPNWESYIKYPESEYNQKWKELVNDYDLVKDNLIFMSGIKKPDSHSRPLIGLLYQLLG